MISPRVKWPESEANQSPLPGAEPRMNGTTQLHRFYVFMACTLTLIFYYFFNKRVGETCS